MDGCLFMAPFPMAAVAVVPPVVVAPIGPNDYIYYPAYEVYYSPGMANYIYIQDGVWVTGPAPVGVSLQVLIGTPSVRLTLGGFPGHHHAANVRAYPRNWAPRGRGR